MFNTKSMNEGHTKRRATKTKQNPVYDDMLRVGGITAQGKGSTNFEQHLKVLGQYRHLEGVCFR